MWLEIDLSLAGTDVEATVTGSRGERPPPRRLDITLDQLEAFARKVSRFVERRMALSDAVVADARALYDALFSGEILALSSRLAERSPEGRLLVRLMLHDSALHNVPWEALCQPGTSEGFLAGSANAVIARGVRSPMEVRPCAIDGAVRLLAIAPSLDERGLLGLKSALEAAITAGGLTWLEPVAGAQAAPRHLFKRLRRGPQPHVIHFLGHGGVDLAGRPTLRLADDEDGDEVWITAESLAHELAASLGAELRLIVLESCEGARPGVFGSAAEVLARAGANAVVAHLWPVRADAARSASMTFYETLADAARGRGDVAVSLAAARRTLLTTSAEGFSPVLYMRGFDPALFDFCPPDERVTTPPSKPSPRAQVKLDNLPPRRFFVGRARELTDLEEALSRARVVSLVALGGAGKTALALEYAHRAAERGSYPGGVWWIEADGSPSAAMLQLATALRIGAPELLAHVPPETSAEEQAEAARVALQSRPARALLVLDAVGEPGFAASLPGGAVRVLATLRDRTPAVGEVIGLDMLAPADARALAEALAGPPEGQAEARALERVVHDHLGGLAVAVEVAARGAKEWAGGWLAYERHLTEHMTEVLDDPRDRSIDYPRGVFAALDRSIDRCPPGGLERALLEGAAVFAPDSLPLEWAYKAAGLDANGMPGKRALATLEGLGLVKVDRGSGTLSIPHLVDKRIESTAESGAWLEASRRATDHVTAWIEDAVGPTRAQMEEVDARRAHIEAALAAASRARHDIGWIRIASNLAWHLQHRAMYAEARGWFERALEKAEQLYPPHPGWVAASLSNLAGVLMTLGHGAEARRLLESAVALFEKTRELDHPHVALSLSNLAEAMKRLGHAAEARPLLERAIAAIEGTAGASNPHLAGLLGHLADVLRVAGEGPEARLLLERALALTEAIKGSKHLNTASLLSSLAVVLKDLGQAAEARPLLERAVTILNETCEDPDHPQVAVAFSNLAVVFEALGEVAEARAQLDRALATIEKAHGPEHPDVAVALSNVAGALASAREVVEARGLLRRAVSIADRAPARPQMAAALTSLAEALRSLGEVDEARRLLQRALALDEATYGPDHPQVASALSNLAALFRDMGRTREARPLFERALSILERSLGSNDLPVLVLLVTLSAVRQDLGDPADARRLLERAASIAERILPADHPWRTGLAARLAGS